jgi:AraC-like DNA-binding protein
MRFEELVRECGGRAAPLLRACQLQPKVALRPESGIPIVQFNALLELTARKLNVPDFGLRLAQLQDIEVIGPGALAMRHAATVGEAIESSNRLARYHNPVAETQIVDAPTPGSVWIFRRSGVAEDIPQRQLCELIVSILYRFLHTAASGNVRGWRVLFPHQAILPVKRYQRYFEIPVVFGATGSGLEIPRGVLAQPIQNANPAVTAMVDRLLTSLAQRHPLSLADRISELLASQLLTGNATIKAMAGILGMNVRTLQRRLGDEGVVFAELVERIRRERSTELLSDGSLPLSQVAVLVGYANQNAFTIACKRWFGVAPGAYRSMRMVACRHGGAAGTCV